MRAMKVKEIEFSYSDAHLEEKVSSYSVAIDRSLGKYGLASGEDTGLHYWPSDAYDFMEKKWK